MLSERGDADVGHDPRERCASQPRQGGEILHPLSFEALDLRGGLEEFVVFLGGELFRLPAGDQLGIASLPGRGNTPVDPLEEFGAPHGDYSTRAARSRSSSSSTRAGSSLSKRGVGWRSAWPAGTSSIAQRAVAGAAIRPAAARPL